ncbi:MAG: ester cyclase [Thermoleophilia bacterium]
MALQEFIDAWNTRDPAVIAALYAPDGVRHQFALPEARLEGRDAVQQGVGTVTHAAPDCVLSTRSQADLGDGRLLWEWTFTGTLQNDFPGLPANGGPLHLQGISVLTFDAEGLITLENVYWDTATLMAQAGMLG